MGKKFVSKYYDYKEFYNEVIEYGFPNEKYLLIYGKELIENFFDYLTEYGNFQTDERVNIEIILHNILQQSLPYMIGYDIITFGLKRFENGEEVTKPDKTSCQNAINITLKYYYEFLYGITEDKKSLIQQLKSKNLQLKKWAEHGEKFHGGRKVLKDNLKDYKAIIEKAEELSKYVGGENFRNATLYYLQSQLNRRPLRSEVDALYKRFNKYYVTHVKK